MKILYATEKNAPDWQEQLITGVEGRIPDAKKWALANGFDRLRVAEIDLTVKPDFAKAVNI